MSGPMEGVFGRKIGSTRVVPLVTKIVLMFAVLILVSNLTTNFINLMFNRTELIKLTKELLVKDLKDTYSYASDQYEIYQFTGDRKKSLDDIGKSAMSDLKNSKAVVLGIDRAKQRISLGLKQLSADPWERLIPERYAVGRDETVKIVKKTDFGYFVGLEYGIEGLIPTSEVPRENDALKEGDEVTARVIRIDRGDRKVALSVRAHIRGADKDSLREFMKQQQKPDTTIGALLKERER